MGRKPSDRGRYAAIEKKRDRGDYGDSLRDANMIFGIAAMPILIEVVEDSVAT